MSGLPFAFGMSDGPVASETYKRAVYRRAPSRFSVQFLSPEKQGSSHSYGFRIFRIPEANASTRSIVLDEYDIWRRWEDCLWFQGGLETAYSTAAREKRNRLAAGKGVKKNGVYVHSDQAASWESLPFGPDPRDVAYDIHQYIPKLSKKATLFRSNQETIEYRFQSLKLMFQALLQDDLPTLIKEIKATDTFTDFFGVWRRDIDLAKKRQASQISTDLPRLSLSSSIFPISPVSPSSVTTKSLSPIKGKARAKVPVSLLTSIHSDSSTEDLPRPGRPSDRSHYVRSTRTRDSSTGTSSSSSSPSSPVSMPRQLPPSSRQPVIASQEVPIRFGHNPQVIGNDHGFSALESLPEDRELSSPRPDLDYVRTRRRSESTSKANRNVRVYSPSTSGTLEPSELSLRSNHSSATLRAAAYLDELGVDYCLPGSIPEPRQRPRFSVSSLASIVTNSSVDAVIPRSERLPKPSANNVQRRVVYPEDHLTEYEPWSEDDYQPEEQNDLLDTYFYDMIAPEPHTPIGYPETPTADEAMYYFAQERSSTTVNSYSSYSDRRSSWTTSVSSGSTSSNPMVLSIKATHEDNTVLFRVSRNITYDELRKRIYDKFIQTDKPTICETFAVALVEQTRDKSEGRPRANSVSSSGSGLSKGGALHFFSSQEAWDDIVGTHYGKIYLRIIGSRE